VCTFDAENIDRLAYETTEVVRVFRTDHLDAVRRFCLYDCPRLVDSHTQTAVDAPRLAREIKEAEV
jgi:hypothetical protein